MRQAEYFIEVVRFKDDQFSSSPMRIYLLKWAIGVTKRINATTIAIFKIYPKPKVFVASYDKEINAVIIDK